MGSISGGSSGSSGSSGESEDAGAPCVTPTGSLSFNGSSDFVQVPDTLSMHAPDLTVEAWVRLRGGGCLVAKPVAGASNDADTFVVWYDNGYLKGEAMGWNGSTAAQFAWAPAASEWHHVAYTFNSNNLVELLYLDGTLEASSVAPQALQYDPNPLVFGGDRNSFAWNAILDGDLADVRIWSVVRTQSEIQSDMSSCVTGLEAGLMGAWPLDEGSGQTARDLSPRHLDGTLGTDPTPDGSDPQWSSAVPP